MFFLLITKILNVLSVFLLLVGSIQFFQATNYIYESINQEYVSWIRDFATIVSYISQACASTYCFSVLFYVTGKMYALIKQKSE